MALDVGGLVAVVVFYVLILAIGIWASRKSKKEEEKCVGSKSEVTMIGGRNINVLVGVFTMTATWVGGGYIMGTAEAVYSPSQGLIWALGPLAYLITFILAGLFFAKPMRSQCYVTMMDPFQRRYGNSVTMALLLPALISDVLWVACILAALGGTMSVILGLSSSYSIVLSAAVAITYTLMGGLYSVAYTDIIQLFVIFISLWLCVPFLVLNPASSEVTLAAFFNQSQQAPLMGELKLEHAGKWIDELLLLALGGLSYQALYQRILSAASSTQAQVTCFAASGIVVIMGVPSVIIGAVAASTDWNQTAYGLPSPFARGEAGKVLPLALHYLTPPWVSVVGIGAVAAAVMSSMDSVLLSSASMFTHNIYKGTLKAQASDRECVWVIRASVLLVGLAGAGLAFAEDSVFAFWLMSGDLIYCLVFPQLICVLHCRCANGYGATAGYLVAVTLRLLSGEPLLRLPTALLFPGWREEGGVIRQYFPFRTLVMLVSLVCIPLASSLATLAFSHRLLPRSWDLLAALGEEERGKEGDDGKPAVTEKLLAISSTSC
ncbi:high-affinity choline transporter 1 isoform X2 [Salmo salar]|uniref:High-affinity choline transporter 1 isoform X2 n=1 Tax=Salmo salar TaxID=8030 RepID=A0ABM3DME4_SALSA|nr:high-affinity choline transporter 1 isoform X2 [Salmo salar]|eukprot:XP_014018859.1 PREDICTED: high-affinity choline transporter 1-like [Salmo salar]